MELKLNLNRSYALALEGGGAKGAYQIGVWKAFREAGVKISAVAGTSVGALNGALIVMDDYKKAESLWRDIRYSKIMNVDDSTICKLIRGDLHRLDISAAVSQFKEVFQNRGFDVTPLYELLREVVDEAVIRRSKRELYFVTVSLSDRKELELRAKDLAEGAICDMLLASAYLPVFRNEPLGGKRYTDGGVRDVLPLHVLIKNGYTDIIALRLYGIGLERRVRIPKTVRVLTVAPKVELGGMLEFEAERCVKNMQIGYYDAHRLLYGVKGARYYLDECWDEDTSYAFLIKHLRAYLLRANRTVSLRVLHESVIPTMSKRLDLPEGDYSELLIACLETAAEEVGIDPFCIYTETQFTKLLAERFSGGTYSARLADALSPKKRLRELIVPDRSHG